MTPEQAWTAIDLRLPPVIDLVQEMLAAGESGGKLSPPVWGPDQNWWLFRKSGPQLQLDPWPAAEAAEAAATVAPEHATNIGGLAKAIGDYMAAQADFQAGPKDKLWGRGFEPDLGDPAYLALNDAMNRLFYFSYSLGTLQPHARENAEP